MSRQSGYVHICIDMQRLFDQGGAWGMTWLPRILPHCLELVAAAPGRSLFTRFIPPRNPLEVCGAWGPYWQKWRNVTREALPKGQLELVDALQPFATAQTCFDKAVYGPWGNPAFCGALRTKGARRLILSGGETDICVLATALGAIDAGYFVLLVQDALCSSVDASHDAALTLFRHRFSVQSALISTEEAAELLRGA